MNWADGNNIFFQEENMIYYRDDMLMIRNMEEADARVFTDEETAQGWAARSAEKDGRRL